MEDKKILTREQIAHLVSIHKSPMYCKSGETAYWIAGSTNHREFVKEHFIEDVKRLQPEYADQILKHFGY